MKLAKFSSDLRCCLPISQSLIASFFSEISFFFYPLALDTFFDIWNQRLQLGVRDAGKHTIINQPEQLESTLMCHFPERHIRIN